MFAFLVCASFLFSLKKRTKTAHNNRQSMHLEVWHHDTIRALRACNNFLINQFFHNTKPTAIQRDGSGFVNFW